MSSYVSYSSSKIAILLSIAWFAAISTIRGQVYTLTNNGSTAQIEVGSQAGLFLWSLPPTPGVPGDYFSNQIKQQWFWYRIGSSGPEASIDTISPASVITSGATSLSLTYADSRLSIEVDYWLTGSPSAVNPSTADIAKVLTLINKSGDNLDLHFFCIRTLRWLPRFPSQPTFRSLETYCKGSMKQTRNLTMEFLNRAPSFIHLA